MKQLISGVVLAGLVLSLNLAQAQSVVTEIHGAPQVAVNGTLKVVPDIRTTEVIVGNDPDDPMKSKSFSRTFAVDQTDKIIVSNKYGEVVVKIWDKNEVKVDVSISAYSKDEDDAQKLLDKVSISAGKTGDQISFKTNIENMSGRYGNSTKNGKTIWRREVRVNYVVFMPTSNTLTLSNVYGNVSMGNFSAALYAKVQYGNFVAGNLNSTNNYISVQYGKATIQEVNKAVIKQQYGPGVTIGTVGTLDLDAQYAAVNISNIKGDAVIKQQYGSGLSIGTVGNLELDAQYTNVNVSTINGNASIKQQYNNISIGTVNKLAIHADYANVKVNTLKGDADFKLAYNKLAVENVGTGCRNLTIDADYAGVALNFSTNYQADFNVRTNYSGFKYGADIASRLESDRGTSKSYVGKIGGGGSATVTVKADYGSITFK